MKKYVSILMALALTACTNDSYETGEGENVQADFVEAHVNADKKVDYVLTDENKQLTLQSLYQARWLEKADTTYRAVLYYRPQGEKVEPVMLSKVSVPEITPKENLKGEMKTDPLVLRSVWVSANKRYLNVGLALMTGDGGDQSLFQRLGVVRESLVQNADNTKTLFLSLYHDQGGVPEYYILNTFFSIALPKLPADSICLYVNTYEGEVVKTLSIK